MNISLVPGFNPGPYTGAGNNTYLIHTETDNGVALIDAGTGDPRHVRAVRRSLSQKTLDRVLITHGHSDHIAGVSALLSEWPSIEFLKMPWPVSDERYPVVWKSLAEGDEIEIGTEVLKVLHTPGHSPDHLSFYCEKEGVLFCGDLLVKGSTVVIPANHEGNLVQYLSSLVRIRELNPRRVLPAHGEKIDDVVGLIDHYLDHRRRRDAEILDALRGAGGSMSVSDIVAVVYKGLSQDLTQAATETVLAHLYKLETEGRVGKQLDQSVDVWACT